MKKHVLFILYLVLFEYPVISQGLDYDPDPWLPREIHLALGNTIDLYSDNIAFFRPADTALFRFSWKHPVGTSDNKRFMWTADRTGNFKLKIKCYYNDKLIGSARTTLIVTEKTNSGTLNLIAIGNSLTYLGFNDQFAQFSNDLSCILNPLGTLGTVYKHEGHGGWGFGTFLTERSPFFVKDTINNRSYISIKKYIETNKFPDPDIFRISLGINDCYGKQPMDEILYSASLLIDTIHHDFPDALIIIAMPTTCEKTESVWIKDYKSIENFETYQLRIRELWKRLHDRYAYGKYLPNIQVSYDGLCIDRMSGYRNAVHPNPEGYRQLARGFSNTLNYYLKYFNMIP